MGLDMYAYSVSLEAVEKYAKHLDEPDRDVTAHSFPARRAARYAIGFIDKEENELQRLSSIDRDNYWQSLGMADVKARDRGFIDTQYHYWRKFNALHGWMEDLWRKRSGSTDNFNCETVRLYAEDLDRLDKEKNDLKPRNGFFFGTEEIYKEDMESLESFLAKAKEDVKTKAIFYDSWW